MKISKGFKRMIAIGIVLAVCLVLFWPFSFEKYIRGKSEVKIAVMDAIFQTNDVKKDESAAAYSADSEEYTKIREILADYSYHYTVKSFVNQPQISGDPNEFVMLILGEDTVILIDTGDVLINGRLYRIGYGDGEKAAKMMKEIKEIMKE